MIDLRQYEIGQRFRTRGGRDATFLFDDRTGNMRYFVKHQFADELISLFHYKDGRAGKRTVSDFDIMKPIYSVPANTRRIPSIQLDPILEKAV